MIRCNNCMTVFESESDLSKILEVQEFDDENMPHTIDRQVIEDDYIPINTERHLEEIFLGCPYCTADEYLMDLDEKER